MVEIDRNTDCDYSSAYVSLYTNSDLVGHGMTFTIGRGNDIVSYFLLRSIRCGIPPVEETCVLRAKGKRKRDELNRTCV